MQVSITLEVNIAPRNAHFLCQGKYHRMADLLFGWLGFCTFGTFKLSEDLLVWPTLTSKAGGQTYNDTCPYKGSEYVLSD